MGEQNLYQILAVDNEDKNGFKAPFLVVYKYETQKVFYTELTQEHIDRYAEFDLGLNYAIRTVCKGDNLLAINAIDGLPKLRGNNRQRVVEVGFIEKEGTYYGRYVSLESFNVVERVAPPEDLYYISEYKKRLLIASTDLLLVTATEDRRVNTTNVLEKRTNGVNRNFELGKTGNVLVYNEEFGVYYVLTSINGNTVKCYTAIDTFTGGSNYIYPVNYEDGTLLTVGGDSKSSKVKERNKFSKLDIFGDTESIVESLLGSKKNVSGQLKALPMIDGFFSELQINRWQSAVAGSVIEEAQDTEALTLFGVDIEKPITSPSGNLCGYSKKKVNVCNLQGVERIDTDSALANIEYEGVIVNEALVSVKANSLGESGHSGVKFVLANGVRPGLLARVIRLFGKCSGFIVFVACDKYKEDQLVHVVNVCNQADILYNGSIKVVFVERFNCQFVGDNDLRFTSIVGDKEQPIVLDESTKATIAPSNSTRIDRHLNVWNCLFRMDTQPNFTGQVRSLYFEGLWGIKGEKESQKLQKALLDYNQKEYYKMLESDNLQKVKIDIGLLWENDFSPLNSSDEPWRGKRANVSLLGREPLYEQIARKEKHFLLEVNGEYLVFGLSKETKFVSGMGIITQRLSDLLNLASELAVKDKEASKAYYTEYIKALEVAEKYSKGLEKVLVDAVTSMHNEGQSQITIGVMIPKRLNMKDS